MLDLSVSIRTPLLNCYRCLIFLSTFSAVPFPKALFTLRGPNGTVNNNPSGFPRGNSVGIGYAPGPFGNPNGSFFFAGQQNSYVELGNPGKLDARFSVSVFMWVLLNNSSGPTFQYEIPFKRYGISMWVYHQGMSVSAKYVSRKEDVVKRFFKKDILEEDKWNFIGTTYDYNTAVVTVWVNNKTVIRKQINVKMELATQYEVRLGATRRNPTYFRGRIACFQVYDRALSDDQILVVKSRCNETSKQQTCMLSLFCV